MKLTRKIMASLLALVMVLLMLPTAFAAEGTTYVLDATADLEPFEKGDKAEGYYEVVHDYFTILYKGEKSAVNGSNKTFDDGYVASQRINFGGKTEPKKDMIGSVKFTTSAAATVKVWWVSGGADRTLAIYDAEYNILTRAAEVPTADKQSYISTMEIPEAGTYYLGMPENNNYIFKIEVTEAAAEEEPPVEIDPPVEPAGYAAYLQYCDMAVAAWTQGGYDGNAAMAGQFVPTDAVGTVSGAGTYTIKYTIPEGVTASSAYLFYVEIVNAYDVLKDLVLSDVKVAIDGTEVAVNQNVAYVNPYDYADAPEKSIYVYHSTVEGSTNNYIIEISNLLAGVTKTKGNPIDLNFAASESISITFTLSEPVVEPPVCQHVNTEVKDAVAATCEGKGYTGNKVCVDCSETVEAGEEIAALGHNYENEVCTVCGNPKTGDVFGIVLATLAVSGMALVVLKKKEN